MSLAGHGIHTHTHTHTYIYIYIYVYTYIGEGNGNPLQYSCLKIPWTEEPGGLQSMGSQRAGHNWATSYTYMVFLHILNKKLESVIFKNII